MRVEEGLLHPHALGMQRRLRALLFPILRRAADVDEAMQETLARLVEAERRAHPPIANIHGFIFTVARNCALDLVRQRKTGSARHHMPWPPLGEEPVEDRLDFERRTVWLAKAVEELPALPRAVFRLSVHHQLSRRETAAHLGLTERQVKSQLQEATRRLSRKLMRAAPPWPPPDSPATTSHASSARLER